MTNQLSHDSISIHRIGDFMLDLKNSGFSGILTWESKQEETNRWICYFRLKRIGWLTGGNNFKYRWKRYIKLFCRIMSDRQKQKVLSEHSLKHERDLLVYLLTEGLLTRQSLSNLMTSVAEEVIFDVIQEGYQKNNSKLEDSDFFNIENQISYTLNSNKSNNKMDLLLPLIDIEAIFKNAVNDWIQWKDYGLSEYSPNLFIVINNRDNIKNKINNIELQKAFLLMNGSRSLRDIARETGQNLLIIAKVIFPFIKSGDISLLTKPKPSFVISSKTKLNKVSKNISPEKKKSLIVCIDDSPLIFKNLESCLVKYNYNFLGIPDPLKALPILLKEKPKLIFLDLLMPIINGYELCSQIRRVNAFKNIPIIILTSKDGLVDRMRAKMVGSTDFLSKPFEEESVVKIIDRYLSVSEVSNG